ncbi:MAG: hypothetical protein HYY10_02470 [Candidatus Liptonbacteria bacterium]|nr:hypothetical protein [Candidatus Liptonbacteria bacterium]
MDEEEGKHSKIDYFGPGIVMAFIAAFAGDLFWLLVIGAFIPPPPIGLTFLAAGLLAHYLAGMMVGGFIFFELKHFVPKAILGAAILLPLPLLMVGMGIALIAQNRIIEILLIQAGTKLLEAGLAATGVGALAAGAVEVAADAKTVQTVARGAKAATTVGKGGRAAETTAQRAKRIANRLQRYAPQGGGGEEGYEDEEEDEGDVPEEAFGVQRGPVEELQQSTMEELPQVEEEPKESDESGEEEKKPPRLEDIRKPDSL